MYDEFARRSNTIEECYEFMLAYAAQGLAGRRSAASPAASCARYLNRAVDALTGLSAAASAIVGTAAAR